MNKKGITPLLTGVLILCLIVLCIGLFYYYKKGTATTLQTGTPINITGTLGITIGSPVGGICGPGCGPHYFLTSGDNQYLLVASPNLQLPIPTDNEMITIDVIGTLTSNTTNCAQTPSLCPSGGTIIVSNWTLGTCWKPCTSLPGQPQCTPIVMPCNISS